MRYLPFNLVLVIATLHETTLFRWWSEKGGMQVVHAIDSENSSRVATCPCGELLPRPDLWKKEATARWMARALDWGVLTTLSSRFINETAAAPPVPFGNVYSFVDGSCTNSTGTPYFYGTYMDQSFQDMKHNPSASFTLSEASLASTCVDIAKDTFVEKACVISSPHTSNHNRTNNNRQHDNFPGDPESPICARLTMTGILVEVVENTDEYQWIQEAFFQRHPQMQYWPKNHDWKIVKLQLQDLWLIDYFGGATVIQPEQYYNITNIQLLHPELTTDGN